MFLCLTILTVNIGAMLLNLDPDIFRSGPLLHSTCSKQFSSFIVLLNNKIIYILLYIICIMQLLCCVFPYMILMNIIVNLLNKNLINLFIALFSCSENPTTESHWWHKARWGQTKDYKIDNCCFNPCSESFQNFE
jgi:hypothetical protein